MDDLTNALGEHGVNARKPDYCGWSERSLGLRQDSVEADRRGRLYRQTSERTSRHVPLAFYHFTITTTKNHSRSRRV